MPPDRLRTLVPLAILIVTAAVYLPALSYGFVCDDSQQIVQSQARFTWSAIPGYFTSDVWSFLAVGKSNYYRPVFLLWLLLNSKLFGLDPLLWHAAAIAAHLAATLLVYFLARRLTGSLPASGIAALLFGVHPVHVEAVAWVSGATEPLFAMLALGMLLCYLRRWRVAALALFALAMFSKETAIVLPVLAIACEWIDAAPVGFRRRLAGAVRAILPFAAVVLVYLAARYHALGSFAPVRRDWSLPTMASTWPFALWFYLRQLLLPWRYSLFYPIAPVAHLGFVPFWGPSIAVLLAAVALAWISRQSRVAAFCALLIVLPVLPVLNLRAFARDDFLHDRYVYLSSAGLCILVGLGVASLASRRPRLWAALLVVIAGALAASNLNASQFWSDDVALYTHAIEGAPESAVTLRYLGAALLRGQRLADAVPYLAKALGGDSNIYYVHLNLAECYRGLGDLEEATVHVRAAIALNPGFPEAYMHLAGVAVLQHRLPEAEAAMRRALELRPEATPTRASYHYLLGTILEEKGDKPGALAEYEADLREDPGSEEARARAAHLRARQ